MFSLFLPYVLLMDNVHFPHSLYSSRYQPVFLHFTN